MLLKYDVKLVAIACILLGLFLGFYVDRTVVSKPNIDALTSQVDTQLASIEELEQDLESVQAILGLNLNEPVGMG